QSGALAGLNGAMQELSQQMQEMNSQGGGAGLSFEQFMQQMQQMAQMQQGINQESLALSQGLLQALAQRQAMSRLADNQARVRKSMQQLAREANDLSGVLGDPDHLAQEMESIESDLRQERLSRETIERQNRILSRMLDAQKSMHKRETSRQRVAETGKAYSVSSPPPLDDDPIDAFHNLKHDLLRAKQEGYTEEYWELINAYFKLLMKKSDEK
ncbi:hypothetical protein JW992_09710, partial [candidate division KSB1 bacterium]|nr:hypothetical protein [candidate division KSB1 bacterium]